MFLDRGVNIVLDPVGASNVEQNIESLGVDGRWVLYGTMGGIGVSNDKFLGLLLRKRIQLLPTTLRGRSIQVKFVFVNDLIFHNYAFLLTAQLQ